METIENKKDISEETGHIILSKKFDTSAPLDFSKSEAGHLLADEYDTSQSLDFSKPEDNSIEKDDNGKDYKVNGELLPNNEYTVRGYEYKTDENGRIISASGDLHWKDHEGRLPLETPIQTIGKGSERPDDDRGHLIADEFNGSNGIENLVPMNSELNRNGDYRKLEKEWEQALKDGKSVNVEIEPQYSDDSRRPDSFIVGYKIDGEYYEKSFANEAKGGF